MYQDLKNLSFIIYGAPQIGPLATNADKNLIKMPGLVVAIGWTLGGTLGLGTIFFALGIGPAIAIGMQILQFRSSVH